jgi:hypothetical protein
MTAVKEPALHDFEGRTVQRATVKITAAGDGLSDALAIQPEEIELDEERSYVLQGSCVRVSIETDKNGITSRVHTIKTHGISPIDSKIAAEAIATYRTETERRKNEVNGQMQLDAEAEAERKEAND